MEILLQSFCSKYNVDKESVVTYVNRFKKILISEKTSEQEKLRNERGKTRNGHTRTTNGTTLSRVARSKS